MIKIENKHFYSGGGIYIGRPTILGNPFTHLGGGLAKYRVATRSEAVSKYKEWLDEEMKKEADVYEEIMGLVNIYSKTNKLTLICWCSPLPCHGGILASTIENISKNREKSEV